LQAAETAGSFNPKSFTGMSYQHNFGWNPKWMNKKGKKKKKDSAGSDDTASMINLSG
jgi:hypothetical protein